MPFSRLVELDLPEDFLRQALGVEAEHAERDHRD
jgi:hypothetical protein